ncbi:hypothetical protein PGTUg99_031243 [Puccinia graminis f. sp. tritici]|uniref:Uncharacterized protein n=2 Tax=Puccinia graminis f. sp. tritici TaxID=56615 RepID=H6QTG0_PUCGT|nr:uncharacterized protein PGTG_22085 [Puccinia graminis f. sp. tritici CRL 75-36-700-3]EHS64175.1 hypothetical protein PGTG_22085 [Puccinia graminis f. sp. tritici CRL 75-36-700-3]KAA1082280.1 hypothetical protein PGTUg99_031243 [Puccinia graminis f. sp. tritici]
MFRREVFMPGGCRRGTAVHTLFSEGNDGQSRESPPDKSRGFRRSDSPPEFLPPQGVGIIFRRAL